MKKLLIKLFKIKPLIIYKEVIKEVQILNTDIIEGDVIVNGDLTVKGKLYVSGEVTSYND